MLLEITKEKTFIPEFNGNKKLSAGEQIVVTYRAATVATKAKIDGYLERKSRFDAAGKFIGVDIVPKDLSKPLADELLIGIKNASYKDTATGATIEIKTAQDLMDAPVEFEELKREIVGVLDREVYRRIDEKN